MQKNTRGLVAVRSVLLGSAVSVLVCLNAAAQDAPAADKKEPAVEKIVVTAQKRSEQLRRVPQSVTAVTEKTLERQKLETFTDYAGLVPGMQIETPQPGVARIVLRGINAGGVGSTVGIYLDETPYGSSNALSNGAITTPDLDTFDIKRIEVLRGPQGTLYGSSTLGGLLKFVTNAPDPSHFEGKAMVGLESVQDGDIGWTAKGMINVPISETIAFRASAYTRTDAGFIDDPIRGLKDINDVKTAGYRASMLFEPNADLSIRLTALAQDINGNNNASVDLKLTNPVTVTVPYTPFHGDLQQAHTYDQHSDVKYTQYNGTIDYNLGFAELTSVTSFNTFEQDQLQEATLFFGTSLPAFLNQDKFVQEVRLTSPSSDKFEWLVGFYHTSETASLHQVLTGIGDVKLDSEFKETAGFANATYYFSPRFDVSFGGRYSTNDQDALQGGTLAPAAHRTSSESVFTYSVAPRLRVNEDTMIYARIAKGYRPGGPNAIPPAAPPGVPVTYGADNLINYEAGFKSDIGEKVSVDVSAFFIDWSDIQLLTIVSGFGVNGNGGTAESKGFEWAIDYRPASNLNLAFTGAYTDATLTADTHPLVGGHAGDELPYAAKWSMMVSGDFNYPIFSGMGYAGASLRYVGDRLDNFNTTFGRLLIPSHNEVDLRTGIDWEQLSLQLYAKNITDERGIMGFQSTLSPTSGGSPGIGGQGATVIQPRSIGASLTARF